MDIHPPHGPVNSFKDFLLHLLTVILGILIALSLEGLIEWHHHRSLAEEARSNLTAEIRENRQLLAGGLPAAPAAEQRLKATIETIEAYRKDRRDDRTSKLDWSFGLFPLSATGWSTASSTGALSYMDYSEVQGYTRLRASGRILDDATERVRKVAGPAEMAGAARLEGQPFELEQ